MSEFTRMIDLRQFPAAPLVLKATAAECTALAKRFDLVAIKQLAATVILARDANGVNVAGKLDAKIIQSCAISAEDLPVTIAEPLTLRFIPARGELTPDEEIELAADDCDEIEYNGNQFDLGEAIAQTMALAIDPFLEGPNADAARKAAGLLDETASGPFAALAALKKAD